MCRLFGLHAGTEVMAATFWLLNAPDSLAAQSRRNPDGTGIGVFGADGAALVSKQPIAAFDDIDFAAEAKDETGTTFLAHVRYATSGAKSIANTHPFLQDGRLFAHNGTLHGLDIIDQRLRDMGTANLVGGQTDSERVFALITGAVRACDGDVGAGLRDAVNWLAATVPIYALNIVVNTATDMWALRYPDTHELYLLDHRDCDPPSSMDLRTHRIRACFGQHNRRPPVVIATEPMDADPCWRLIEPGQLIHVDSALTVTSELAFPEPPARQLRAQDLSAVEHEAQHPWR